MNKQLLGFMAPFIISYVILTNRKHKWMNLKIQLTITLTLLLFGLYGLKNLSYNKIDKVFYYGFCTPIIHLIMLKFFKYVSYKTQDRDFHLWLRGSSEVNQSIFSKNPHVTFFDKAISITLLIIIITTLLGGANMIRN